MENKTVYPLVRMIEKANGSEYNTLELETYLRLKHRGKYYLCRYWKEIKIKRTEPNIAPVEVISFIEHLHIEVYRMLKLMRVDLKMVATCTDPPKPVFELDLDQISEEERLLPESNYDPSRFTKR